MFLWETYDWIHFIVISLWKTLNLCGTLVYVDIFRLGTCLMGTMGALFSMVICVHGGHLATMYFNTIEYKIIVSQTYPQEIYCP